MYNHLYISVIIYLVALRFANRTGNSDPMYNYRMKELLITT